jgi:heme-degrading monooxygenase HmoA
MTASYHAPVTPPYVSSTTDSTSIRHTVAFRLRHPAGSEAERDFLQTARALAEIPGVQEFEQLRQVSPKSDFTFFFSMLFADATAYQHYNEHSTHVAFVRDRWDSEVTDFQELDFVAL